MEVRNVQKPWKNTGKTTILESFRKSVRKRFPKALRAVRMCSQSFLEPFRSVPGLPRISRRAFLEPPDAPWGCSGGAQIGIGSLPSAFGDLPSTSESLRKAFVGLRESFFWSLGRPRSEKGGPECRKTMEKQGQNADFVRLSNIDSATLSEGSGSGPDVFPERFGSLQKRPRTA